MKKMMMIAGVGLMSTTLFVGCQNASPESKRIGSAAIGGGAGGAVGKHIGGNIGAGLGAALGAGVAANAKGSSSKTVRNSA
ncbi:DNA transfer protein p32, partial [Acinetobacter baumannii]|nr:DNA transfer protein p32 [Acinetobacter baumannii]